MCLDSKIYVASIELIKVVITTTVKRAYMISQSHEVFDPSQALEDLQCI